MHSLDEDEDHNPIAQKLCFSTPQKDRSREWKLSSTADNLTRNLFDSNNKSECFHQEITRIVMPYIPAAFP